HLGKRTLSPELPLAQGLEKVRFPTTGWPPGTIPRAAANLAVHRRVGERPPFPTLPQSSLVVHGVNGYLFSMELVLTQRTGTSSSGRFDSAAPAAPRTRAAPLLRRRVMK